jgi:hypothetical protein
VSLREAELHLACPLQRGGRTDGQATVLGIESVGYRATVFEKGQVGTDPIHLARIAARRRAPIESARGQWK